MKKVLILLLTLLTSCEKTNKTNSTIETNPVIPTVEPVATTQVEERKSPCDHDMIHIVGEMCVKPLHKCTDWIDDPTLPYARCAEYESSVECVGSHRVHMEFCIDKYEASNVDGMPIADVSWTESSERCVERGLRLCKESEWTFACEGEDVRPYPYGWQRRSDLCNHDIGKELVCGKYLCDHRKKVKDPELMNCATPEGVVNMTGNIDEWVLLEIPHYSQKNGGRKMMSGLKGGWWGNLRNRCRPVTVDHDEYFHELQTGFRCCSDVRMKMTNNL